MLVMVGALSILSGDVAMIVVVVVVVVVVDM